MNRTVLVLAGILGLGAGSALAQDPPPLPPVVGPPALPPAQTGVVVPQAEPSARVTLTDDELRRRREAIYVMEGILEKRVALAANATTTEIETFSPGLRLSMFSARPPQARGNYLEDYGVFFQVQIPTYLPSVVQVIEDIQRNRNARPQVADPAQPTTMLARPSPDAVLDPDAFYVNAVRRYLIDAMLEYSKSLDLRPNEWLAVSARGDDAAPGQLSQPSIMMLRVRGSDLIDFLAGRLTRDEVRARVSVKGFSGR